MLGVPQHGLALAKALLEGKKRRRRRRRFKKEIVSRRRLCLVSAPRENPILFTWQHWWW